MKSFAVLYLLYLIATVLLGTLLGAADLIRDFSQPHGANGITLLFAPAIVLMVGIFAVQTYWLPLMAAAGAGVFLTRFGRFGIMAAAALCGLLIYGWTAADTDSEFANFVHLSPLTGGIAAFAGAWGALEIHRRIFHAVRPKTVYRINR